MVFKNRRAKIELNEQSRTCEGIGDASMGFEHHPSGKAALIYIFWRASAASLRGVLANQESGVVV